STGFPPLNQVLAKRLMEKTKIYQYANSVGLPLNDKLLEKILVKFSQLVVDFPEIKEIDINPLIVNQNSAVAVDSRIVIDQDAMMRAVDSREHLVIAPYPKKYTSKWKLKNEVEVIIRPIKPEDEILFNDLFKSLSAETMRFRFFEIIKSMSHQLLTRYCNLDYDREIALVAELNEDERKIVGVARLIIEPSGTRGEFAVLVSDSWQGQGLGSKLLDSILIIAKDMGVKTVYSDVIASNYKMIRLAEKKGFRTERFDDTTKILIDFD
ncbi:GNAT family N-acetyltransferase, partial [Candidatus Bathyarchaeota archaeon]|nr:GNAT family N-acetyltransferase [Candidatus Bathyarchaeota archaeon]